MAIGACLPLARRKPGNSSNCGQIGDMAFVWITVLAWENHFCLRNILDKKDRQALIQDDFIFRIAGHVNSVDQVNVHVNVQNNVHVNVHVNVLANVHVFSLW